MADSTNNNQISLLHKYAYDGSKSKLKSLLKTGKTDQIRNFFFSKF